MDSVRIGLVGCGTMGFVHARYLIAGQVHQAWLAAICDAGAESLARMAASLPPEVKQFNDAGKLFASGSVDAVIIATPHYSHPPLAIEALARGLHVLVEKPAGVHTQHVRQMNAAAAGSGRVFAIMFNRRTRPLHRKLKEMIDAGELGPMKRIVWLATRWYRSQSYYDACSWRATWKGEGGGVLLNQCIHQLDLWQWICGMPSRVRAFCRFGRYHPIEVEDDVTAYLEYDSGATGVFLASTGETPGTDRLEIAGDRGKIVLEDDRLTFWRTRVGERQFNAEHRGGFGQPESSKCEIPVQAGNEDHKNITANWVQAILRGEPLIAPGEEGIKSLELANAMVLSTWRDNWVRLPVEDQEYLQELNRQIAGSRAGEPPARSAILDVEKSF